MDSPQTTTYSLMEDVLFMCLRKEGDVSGGKKFFYQHHSLDVEGLIAAKCPAVGIEAGILLELVLRDQIQRETAPALIGTKEVFKVIYKFIKPYH
jgi:hypothetical protein